MENPLKTHKYGNSYDRHKAKGMSSRALLLSVVLYVSIFYIFGLSPSTLLERSETDLYEAYVLHGQARRTHVTVASVPVPSFVEEISPKEEEYVADQKKNEIPVRTLDDKLKQQQQQQKHAMKPDGEACDHQTIKPRTIRRSKFSDYLDFIFLHL
ncbi:hypothetical protein F3Y22_tig00000773pilonHSYRG00176 [Hibiscus syriacus]|uniref:Uncharacterized protein n=1 Tax=Hibiscus syriacus TaxID=106335 RepID=A0A6A3D0V4_HIBSY|nr:hypothetical protein F3Y22_tig00000773pilonHSYRG00176 [Hibiscus syriacus]